MRRFAVLFGSTALLMAAAGLHAQSWTTAPCSNENRHEVMFGDHDHVCEQRRTILPLVNGRVDVTGKNGGIEIVGEDRSDVSLEVRVIAEAPSRDDAESIVRQVKIVTDGMIHAEGPQTSAWQHRNWAVNFELHVPSRIATSLRTENGGIEISHVNGIIQATTQNGGLSLTDLAGDVHATTVNGGVKVELAGNRWDGTGLVAESTNGGVKVRAPEDYSAHVKARTVNGGISVGFPITVQGTIRNYIDTNLGQGGAPLEFQTVNGGVSIERD